MPLQDANPTPSFGGFGLSVLRGQSPSFQPPTRHSGGGRNPEGRGRGESHQSQKSHESQFRQLPSRPFAPFVDNPRHSNRPPVIPAAAGIQRGGDVGNPTNHKNHTNHSSDNSLRAPSRPSWTIPVIPTAPHRHSGGGRNPEGRGRGESQKSHESQFRQNHPLTPAQTFPILLTVQQYANHLNLKP